ncbi:MAG: LamG domain-containing protein [Candidatus Marinimicrobia bacterium]|nr:LamG domain-containing protein [Candidatus Neomarinimicrobiota bacterium]
MKNTMLGIWIRAAVLLLAGVVGVRADVAALRAAAASQAGLAHHWTFEGDDPLADRVGGNDLEAVVIGRGYGASEVVFPSGADPSNRAMQAAFDPANRSHGASLITREAFDYHDRPFTIEALIRAEPNGSPQYWYALGQKSGARGYYAYLPEPGRGQTLAAFVGDSAEQELSTDFKAGAWYYYALTLNHGHAIGDAYIGEITAAPVLHRIAVNAGRQGSLPRGQPLAIGGLAEDGTLISVWCGAVDEVAIYDGQLSEDTIMAHFAALCAAPDGAPPAVTLETRVLAEPVQPAPPVATADFLRYVRAYADALIAHGRARLPDPQTPLFPITLDRATYALPAGKVGALITARVPQEFAQIANPHHDLNFYQVLYALTRFTGEPKYAQAADRALDYFLNHCQEPRYGFFCWGEHLGWDLRTGTMGGFPADNAANAAIHEFYRPWIYWDQSFTRAPEACLRYARAIWRHQMNHEGSLSFSRHAMIMKGDNPSRRGLEFPRHGGFYIATWAAAYAHTQDPEMLTAVEQLVSFYEARRHPVTGAIPHGSQDLELDRDGRADEIFYAPSPLSLAIDLHAAAEQMPPALGARMRALARSTDQAFLALPHDPGPDGPGFVVFTRPGEREPREFWLKQEDIDRGRPARRIPYTGGWQMGYIGQYPHSWLASGLIARYRQTQDEGYRRLILACADNYRQTAPAPGDDVTAGALGNTILLLNAAYEISGDEQYLARAEWFGRLAATQLWPDEHPLPLPSTRAPRTTYAASSRCDTVAMALLATWQLRTNPEARFDFIPTDR